MSRLTLVVGVLGAIALVVNRWFTPELLPSQTRSDGIGIALSALAILLGLLGQKVQPTPPLAVTLLGEEGFFLAEDLPPLVKAELAWASHALLTNTVTQVICLYYRGRTLLQRGKLPPEKPRGQITLGAIATRCLQTQKPVYLANLSLYPGKTEFDYLPSNTQGVILQPIASEGLLILGANVPRSYTPQDERWIGAITDKLAYTLENFL
jgi:hypothetical protein